MKKVIEQDFFLYIGDIEVSSDSDGDIEVLQWNKNREGGCDIVHVGKSKAREVALAICPELESELAEKDKVIERLKRRKLVHQLFIGKVADILSIEKVQELLRESNESLNKMI